MAAVVRKREGARQWGACQWLEKLESRRFFSSISGVVYNDRNNSATYEGSGPDIPWPGVTVFLDNNQNGQLDAGESSVVTQAFSTGNGGIYTFSGLGLGTYHIGIVQPGANYVQTYPLNNADQTVTISNTQLSTLGVNFGIRDTTQSSTISGRAFADTNANGTRDGLESYLQGVTVWADLHNNSAIDTGEPTTTTDSTGLFTLKPLNPNYTATFNIRAIPPSGLTQTKPASNAAFVVTIDAGNGLIPTDIFGFADLTPPMFVQSKLVYDTKPQGLEFDLSEPNANGSFTVDFSLSVVNLDTATTLQVGSFTLQNKNSAAPKWVVNTSFYPTGQLPEGNYRATIPANTFKDAAGNVQGNAYSLDFFVRTADANHDRYVNTLDFNALATNFGRAGTFSGGDFDYSGSVTSADFDLLAARFGSYRSPPAGSAPIANAVQNKSLFADQPVAELIDVLNGDRTTESADNPIA